MDRILHVLTSTETWTNIAAFAIGWALAEVRAWVAGRLTLRRWQRDAINTLHGDPLMAPGGQRQGQPDP